MRAVVAAARLAYAPLGVHASDNIFCRSCCRCDLQQGRKPNAALQFSCITHEAAMEVFLLILDEIDDYCLMAWQHAVRLLELG